ncbi:transporter substrate-binding domain-containing protein [Permianibacter sp. IMCC34836]|uniref:substrate-binding periplasmic protein n=1 Tax=Permianibacter fluminis TaxID=2738515 RepID=UPI0015566A0F|nr:transporter substrate-binding domain-containing protein [Permianibacter fluminis]NQD36445.1 transporter substrate-binding domain-containing protein [Permianibacter fluminis]
MLRWRHLLLAMLLLSPCAFAGKQIKLSSLDWPPYTGPALADKGATAAVVKAAFEAAGYSVQIDFFPWERAVAMASDASSGYAGYFPEYYSADIAKDFLFSEPVGNGPLGLAQNKEAPISWNTLDDLSKLKVGVVQGYVNTEGFDANVAAKKQTVEAVTSDAQNLNKVAAKRIPVAIIDQNVMNYLLGNDASLAAAKGKLEFNSKVLEDKKLYICFRKGPQGEEYAKALAEGLKKIDVAAIVKAHLK